MTLLDTGYYSVLLCH